MNKILLTGKTGQLGWELERALAPLGQVIALDRSELDLAKPESIARVVRTIQPNIIVNAAAYTAVDKAETEPKLALAINGSAPGFLAEEAKCLNAILVHYSTDYVFDGNASTPYFESDLTRPLNVYGHSKLAGELAIQEVGGNHLILRTSWVYGMRGKNFLLTMLRLAKEKALLKVVEDQIGAPTWSRLIAETTARILTKELGKDAWGIYHLTASGQTSWYSFADSIFRLYNRQHASFHPPQLVGISSKEYPTPARRPQYSVMSNDKLCRAFDLVMPDWKASLELCLSFQQN